MKNLLANQLYAVIYEILKDNELYYFTELGPEYCKLTESGEKEVLKLINLFAPKMVLAEKNKLIFYAQNYVVQELKK